MGPAKLFTFFTPISSRRIYGVLPYSILNTVRITLIPIYVKLEEKENDFFFPISPSYPNILQLIKYGKYAQNNSLGVLTISIKHLERKK